VKKNGTLKVINVNTIAVKYFTVLRLFKHKKSTKGK